ncbi:MAG: helix-turn-helix domain-containing protein [Candidatus Bathyarchaeia archaeon]|jgi:transposase
MSEKINNEKMDKIIKRLDIITVILLVQSGMKRSEIAQSLGVSEKTIERLIPVSKIKGKRDVEKTAMPKTEGADTI